MRHRLDMNKSYYVLYDYQQKGDRFTRGLSPLPRVYTTVTRYESGYRFKRRLRTNQAKQLTVTNIKNIVGPELAGTLEHHTFYFHYDGEKIELKDTPPGVALRFTVTEQYKGKRHWFICVHCQRRVGKLFLVELKTGHVWGCQKCLGLTYPSQARHKSVARDNAIVEGKLEVSFKEWCRAHERYRRRFAKLAATSERLGW